MARPENTASPRALARMEQETQAGPSDSDGPRTLKVRGPSRARSDGVGPPDRLPLATSQLVARAWTEGISLAGPVLRFAAWFWWMMPLEAALSSLREATFRASPAASASPAETAVRTLRTWVLSSDFAARLRSRACSFVLFRLIWDLMFATKTLL